MHAGIKYKFKKNTNIVHKSAQKWDVCDDVSQVHKNTLTDKNAN